MTKTGTVPAADEVTRMPVVPQNAEREYSPMTTF